MVQFLSDTFMEIFHTKNKTKMLHNDKKTYLLLFKNQYNQMLVEIVVFIFITMSISMIRANFNCRQLILPTSTLCRQVRFADKIYPYLSLLPRSNSTARKRPVPWIYGDFVEAVFRPEFFGFFRCLPAISDRKRLELAGFFPRYSAHNRVLGTGT